MLFHKSFVSLVAAIALASSVTASATLARRNPPAVSPAECTASNDHLTCCDSTSSFSSQSGLIKTLLQVLVLDLDLDLLVGANCLITGTVAWYCTPRLSYSIRWLTHRSGTQQSTCCEGVQNQSQCPSSLRPWVLADESIIRWPRQRWLQLHAHRPVKAFSSKAVVQVATGVSQRVGETERVAECRFWCFLWIKY